MQHESFLNIAYTKDTTLWINHFGPTGTLRAWLEADKRCEMAPFMTKEVRIRHEHIDLPTLNLCHQELEYASITGKNGYDAPTRWYKLFTEGLFAEDDKRT